MQIITYILNLPWTIIGIIFSLISIPEKFGFSKNPFAFVINIKSFWWYEWLPGKKGVRAITIGNVVLLSRKILEKDLEHELVHVKQFNRAPFVFPILYFWENLKSGAVNNKYEKEAYGATNSSRI